LRWHLSKGAGVVLCLMFALAATPALADPYPTPIKVSAGPLAHTLQEIARQTGGELLFDHSLVAGHQAQRIDARTTTLAAVQIALAGSGLNVRRAASGALIIEAPAPAPLARQDAPAPEILVIGRRSQNADIRRTERDVQPYQVISTDELVDAHVDDLGQYFDTRVTANAALQVLDSVTPGAGNSQINLRGLGTEQTLVLVDGRRMPDFPANVLDVTQPDINALPLHDIDRVEVLTGTAGGIYGYGALGGVVNVVLAHDRPGAEIDVTSGVTSRGDAARTSLEARVEYSPDHGATDVTLDLAATRSQALTAGERDYQVKDNEASYANDPSLFIDTNFPSGNAIGVFSEIGSLVLKPQYGGAALGSTFTTLPTTFAGNAPELASALVSGAGKLNLGLSSGEAATDIGTNPDLESLLMNVRHDFGGGFEAYFDGVMLWDHGRSDNNMPNDLFLSPSSPFDPFQQYVLVAIPSPPIAQDYETHNDSSRFTVGVVAPLPYEWRATAEATWGAAQYEQAVSYRSLDPTAAAAADPFGGWAQLQAALQAAPMDGYTKVQSDDLYQDQSLRLAGPVFQAPAGPAILTVLAERRGEDVPAYAMLATGDQAIGAGTVASRSTITTSISAELRSRIFGDEAPSPLLRGLEVQLAVRDDSQANDFSVDPTLPGAARMHVTFNGASYTAGGKVSPLPWLTLRGSFATGQTPPPPEDLIEMQDSGFTADPRRGGQFAFFTEQFGGSPNLKNVLATTASVGFLLTPHGPRGFQFSLDYSHIDQSHDFEALDDGLVLAHEAYWPGRVQRGPLTAADQALGYTGGPITSIDATGINGASLDIQTLDAHLDWPFALPVGWLRLYGTATYNFNQVQKALFMPTIDSGSFLDAPLTWRANAGVDWSLGTLTIGANVQYFGSYNIADSQEAAFFAPFYMLQGSQDEPSQTYVDLHVSKRIHLPNANLRVDFGVNDVFDTAPPRLISIDSNGGYSLYGDPRRRRFELSVSSLF
jgi:iron complex outermembrane receptor protein